MSDVAVGTPRYFAWLYSDPKRQAVLTPLFGIEAEINAALQPGLEHSVAHVRMTWWAEEAQRLRAGHAVHPLSRELLAQWQAAGATAGPDVSGLVQTASWDLASATFETRPELTQYCERWARSMIQLAAEAAAVPAPTAQQFGLGLGAALCELDLLLCLAPAARLGRLRLPLEELAAISVEPAAVAQPPWPAALCEQLRQRHRELRHALAAACALLHSPAQRATLRGLLVWAAQLHQHSRRAEAALPLPWPRSRWDGLSDALRAWRVARRAMHPAMPNLI